MNEELREFLRSRRARLDPPAGSGSGSPSVRRVPGLRREEVARLAGVSVDYYSRLEQGRAVHASAEVLDAVARALELDDTERAYLTQIASASRKTRRRPAPRVQRVRPQVRRLLETLGPNVPAFVFGRRMDVLAINRLAASLLTDFEALPPRERNMLRFTFLYEPTRELYADWDQVARENAHILRLDAGRNPDDPLVAELVGELAVRSQEFRRWWAEHDVTERSHGTKRYHHPLVGDLTVDYECLALPGDPDQTLCVYTTEAGSASETALQLLANWSDQPAASTATDDTDTSATAANDAAGISREQHR